MAYTDEELQDCLRQLTDQLGEPPTASQCDSAEMTPAADTYCRRFGSWNAALKAVGLSINKERMKYADDELTAMLREFGDTLGETPTKKQLDKEPELPCVSVYEDRFGSWNTALEAASLSVNKQASYSDDELIDALCEFADTLGETPTLTQVNEASEMPSATPYKNHFGSWNTALEMAGLDINEETSFTNQELLTVLQDCATELGHTPSRTEMDNHTDLPSAATYASRFGSWNSAIRAAGLEVNHEPEQYNGTDEELLEMLREFASERDKSPTMEDVNCEPKLPNSEVFVKRLGGWNEAKQEAGLDTTHQPNRYTDRELILELRRVAQTVEKPLTIDTFNQANAPSPSTYYIRFGSWTEAKQEAGLVENQETQTQ